MSEAEQRKMRRKANKEKAIQREKQNGPTKNAGVRNIKMYHISYLKCPIFSRNED